MPYGATVDPASALPANAPVYFELTVRPEGDQWQSGRWYLRDNHCRLVPGDSPLGYRLPLASQPWVTAAEYPFIHPTDPNQDLPELPDTAVGDAVPRLVAAPVLPVFVALAWELASPL